MSQESDIKSKAKADFLKGDGVQVLADRYGVNRKTIQRWANEGAWREQRTVVAIKPSRKSTPADLPQPGPTRPRHRPVEIDELEIVDLALSDLSAVLGGEVDPRAMGSIASGLCRLIELRLKLKPRTAAEVAELAIGLGLEPREFVQALKDKWRLRA